MTQGNKNVKLVRITDPRRNASTVDYYSRPEDDPKFKWSTKTVTNRLGHPTRFAYTDPDGQSGSQIQAVVTDAEDHASTFLTDGFGRPAQITNAKNEVTKLSWDADNNVVRFEEPNAAVTLTEFDAKTGYPTVVKDPEAVANGWSGTVLSYQTGLSGHIAELTGKRSSQGRAWTFSYTAEGDLASVTDPLGTATPAAGDFTTTYTFDTWGQLLTATDANGHTTTNSRFDGNGYPQTITDALANSTDFEYDVRGQVTKVTDALDKVTTQTYDAFGRPLVRTEPKKQAAGQFIVSPAPVYDANDNVTVSTAPNGAVSTSAYDAADQLTHSLAPLDQAGDPQRKTSFSYDRVGNLLTITEPNGNLTTVAGDYVTTHVYDEVYQLVAVLDAENNKTSYEYDSVGNQITVVDPRKNASADPADFTTRYAYDRAHRQVRSTDALGKFTTTTYDRDGLVVATSDQLGSTTEHTLDARGMVTETRVPHRNDGGTVTYRVTRYEYDQAGNPTRVISPRGVATTDDPDDFAQVTVYDELSRVKETLTEFDRDDPRYGTPDRTMYTYDDLGRMVTVSAPPSSGESVRNDTRYTYFDNGWAETATDPWGIRTAYDYDALGGQTLRTVTSAGGSSSRTMTWQYFPDGKLKGRADDGVPVGSQVVLVDNSDFNNVAATGTWPSASTGAGEFGPSYQTNDAGTGADTFTWGLNIPQNGLYEVFVQYPSVAGAATDARFTVVHSGGSTVRTVDQTANTGTWVSLGRIAFTEGNAAQVSLSDEATGTVVADAVKLVRDNSGETDTERYDYTYAYDANGNQTSIIDNSSSALVDQFDVGYTGLNQVETVRELASGALRNTTTFAYNENGAPVSATHDTQHASFTYDTRNLIASITNGTAPGDPGAKTTTFTYTDRGEPLRQVKGNGNAVGYTYHLDGLPRSVTERKADETLVAEHTLDYDLNGNRTRDVASIMNADNHSAYLNTTYGYTYDPRNRISALTKTGAGAGTETYIHDANNNVIAQTAGGVATTYNYDRNRLLTATAAGTTSSFNYDPFGRLDTVTAAGTIIERTVYDGFDHVLEHRRTGAGTTRFTYDPWDRTATRTTNAGTGQAKTTTFAYLGLAAEVLTEEVAGAVETSYQYTPWGERLSQIKHNAGGGPERTYYTYNAHADVELLTGESGDAVTTYGYTAYGSDDTARFTGTDKPDPADPAKEPYNAYRFNAKRWDQATASYDMGFRDYSPGLNRFLTRDTYNGALADLHLGLDPFTGSRYAFGGGNPISSVEFDGHCSINPLSWGDCASDAADAIGDAASWVGDQADAAWDAAWEFGSDIVSGVGDFLGDAAEWVAHNADALADIALDALEIIGGAAAIYGGISLVVTGIGACAASTPLVVTGVGAIATAGVCWGGIATAAGGIALAGLGVAMVADGASRLPDNIARLESTGGSSGSSRPDPPRLDETGKVHGDIPSHVPDHWTREQLEELEEDLQTSIRTRQQEQLTLGEDGPHRARINEELQLLRQIQKKLSGS
jgi:RHS repeat-associated protein